MLLVCLDVAKRDQEDREDEWRIYASVNYALIGSYNGLSLIRRQAVKWTSDDIWASFIFSDAPHAPYIYTRFFV